MKKVYKSKQSEALMMELYDKQLKSLNITHEDLYVETRFGKTHILKIGNPDGKPLLFFHGGNSTAPHNLERFPVLLDRFCVYAVDIIGHPGKSSQTVLSHKSMDYGWWASDVITDLGFSKMCCVGNSFGAGVIVKLMCAAPEKVEKSVLIVPSGIANMSTFSLVLSMGIPMVLYVLTKNEKWLIRALMPMAIEEKHIDDATYEMVKYTFEHVAVKAGMPSNVSAEDLRNYTAPTFLIPAENDHLFPGEKVVESAKKMISNLKIHMLEDLGHLCMIPDDVMDMIEQFIDE